MLRFEQRKRWEMEAVTKRGDNMGKCTQKEKIDGWEG